MPSSSKNFPLSLSNVLSRFTRRRTGNYRRSLSSCGTSCGNIPEPSLCHTGSQAPAQRCNHLRIQITSHEVPHPHWDKNTSPSAAAQPPAAFPSLCPEGPRVEETLSSFCTCPERVQQQFPLQIRSLCPKADTQRPLSRPLLCRMRCCGEGDKEHGEREKGFGGKSRRRGERGGQARCPRMTEELNEARIEGYMGWTGRKQQCYGDGDKN